MNHSVEVEWWRPGSLAGPGLAMATHEKPIPLTEDSSIAFWALMAFLFILLISPQTIFPVLAPMRIAMLTAGLAVMTHIVDRLKRNKPIMEFTREIKLVLALVIWALLTVPMSYWPGGSVSFLLELYLKTLIVFWLIGSVVNTFPRLNKLSWGFCLMSIPLAMTAIKNFFMGAFLEQGGDRVNGYNAPLTDNPNDLALMINLIIPVCIALFLSSRRPVVRMLLAAIIGVNIMAVFFTFSRGGFLTLAVILMAYGWTLRNRPERGWVYLALLLFMMTLPFIPASYTERISTITNIEADQTGSAQERWASMIAATKFVSQHPLTGAGLGMNVLALSEEQGGNWREIHNVYLQYAVELGLPGLILFLWLIRTSFGNIRAVLDYYIEKHKFIAPFYLAEGIRISLMGFVIAAFFYPVGYHFYFYLIAGLAASAKLICTSEHKEFPHYVNEHRT